MIIKIVIIAIICVFLSSSLKSFNAEFSHFIAVAGGVLVFLLCVDELKQILDYIKQLYNLTNLNFEYFDVVLKIIGVGYITEFTAEMCEDFDNKGMASKVLLGGKIVICGMAIPVIKDLLTVLLSLLS